MTVGGEHGTAPVRCKHKISVWTDAALRDFLDRLASQHGFVGPNGPADSDLVRVLLASAFLAGRSPRDRAAAALYANAMHGVSQETAAFVASLRSELARIAADIIEADLRVRVPPPSPGNGSRVRDRRTVQVRLDDFLRRRFRRLVALAVAMRKHHGAPPVHLDDEASRRLASHLASDSRALYSRSPAAEVIRWAIGVEPQRNPEETQQVLGYYRAGIEAMNEVIRRSMESMSQGALAGLRSALEEGV